MANTKKYVSLDKLGLYDEKIKKFLADADGVALQSAKDYADGLASNYDAVGSANTALESAKAYADGKDAAIQAAQKTADDAAAAAAVADGKAVAAQGEIDALEIYVGTIPETAEATNIIAYVQEKTAGIATDTALEELTGRVAQAETDIDNIEKDYLKAADKTELQSNINTVQTAVDTEKSRAEGIESGLRTDINTVMGDYLKAADKTELQGNIDTVSGALERLTNGVSAEEVDGVNDLIEYVKEHGTEVTGMKEDIADNAEAIAGVAERMGTAEGKITALETASALHAEKTYVDEQVQALQGVDTGLDNRLKAVEGAVGESGSVANDIATAKQEAIDAAAADATSKAGTAESNAKSHADSLNTAMNTRVEALEAIDHDHSNKAELDLIATGDKAKWDAAAGKAHEHSNLAVLEGITADKVTAWDKVTAKADQTALQAEIDRATAAEEANAAAIAAFVEVSQEEIEALFA